jgi:hypothetical protein
MEPQVRGDPTAEAPVNIAGALEVVSIGVILLSLMARAASRRHS